MCPIPVIDFDFFWKLSTLATLPFLFTLVKDIPALVDAKKTLINQQIGIDQETGIPFLPKRNLQKLLGYDVHKRIRIIWLCMSIAILATLSYGIFNKVPALSNSLYYECTMALLTILGLLPSVIAIALGIHVVSYILNLSQYSK